MATLRPRVIPCLLVKDGGLVKTVKFRDPTYVGDPINAVRIFNDKGADELAVLDIAASRAGRGVDFGMISKLTAECFMPLAFGGGIRTLAEIDRLIQMGVEKVILNTVAFERPSFIREAASNVGSQSVVVSIDVDRGLLGGYRVRAPSGASVPSRDPAEVARIAEENGAGEIFLQAIHRDGTLAGYDLELVKRVTSAVRIPVIACGGARTIADLAAAVHEGNASAAAAGSMFVFQGPHRAVLIQLPGEQDLAPLYGSR